MSSSSILLSPLSSPSSPPPLKVAHLKINCPEDWSKFIICGDLTYNSTTGTTVLELYRNPSSLPWEFQDVKEKMKIKLTLEVRVRQTASSQKAQKGKKDYGLISSNWEQRIITKNLSFLDLYLSEIIRQKLLLSSTTQSLKGMKINN